MEDAITSFTSLSLRAQIFIIGDMVKKFGGSVSESIIENMLGVMFDYPELVTNVYMCPDRHAIAKALIHMAGNHHGDLEAGTGELWKHMQKHTRCLLEQDVQRFATMPLEHQNLFAESYFRKQVQETPENAFALGSWYGAVISQIDKYWAYQHLTLFDNEARATQELIKYREANNLPFTLMTIDMIKKGTCLGQNSY